MKAKKHVQVVSLEQPCTACLITTNLLKEMLTKLKKKNDNFELSLVNLSHINQLKNINGLEVEKLPAILIDDEQISAGSIPKREILNFYIYGADDE